MGRKVRQVKDLSKILHTFTKDLYSYRDDLAIQITKKNIKRKPHYNINILVHIKLTDGLYTMIHKGIDRNYLRSEIKSYFNLTEDDFNVTYQNVYPETLTYKL
jgi:hypothetical protein